MHLLGLRDDVADLLASADAFVLPSRSEGLPLALLEAMFAGLPIVATRVGEVPAALADGDAGLLVEPGHPGELAGAIDRLLRDAELARRLGGRARVRALAEFDVTRMAARYESLYAPALNGSRR
jgi:glycosyltransferase involved in cell wall biosynthesis